MLIEFEDLSRPVLLERGSRLLPFIAGVFNRWKFQEAPALAARDACVTVKADGAGYRIFESASQEAPFYRDEVDLACGLVVRVNRAWLRENEQRLCLHGASACFAGRLVVFPNTYRSGKSVLSGCLGAADIRVYGDDILPIRPGSNHGQSIGVAPRLRLPLPPELDAGTRRFIERNRGVGNKRYLYLRLDDERQAGFGEHARIGAFVLLNRASGAEAKLKRVSEGVVLKRLVLQNFARDVPVNETLGRLHSLVTQAGCYRLTYSDPDRAVTLLKSRFVAWPDETGRKPAGAPAAAPKSRRRRSRRGATSGPVYVRADNVCERLVDSDLFLVDSGGKAIYHLNVVGAGLWRLLDGSHGLGDAVSVLREAFPYISREDVEKDVRSLIHDLSARGLLTQCAQARASGV